MARFSRQARRCMISSSPRASSRVAGRSLALSVVSAPGMGGDRGALRVVAIPCRRCIGAAYGMVDQPAGLSAASSCDFARSRLHHNGEAGRPCPDRHLKLGRAIGDILLHKQVPRLSYPLHAPRISCLLVGCIVGSSALASRSLFREVRSRFPKLESLGM